MAAPQNRPNMIGQRFWETNIFLADWPEQSARGGAVAEHIRAFAQDLDTPIASGVAVSAKPESGLIESPLNFFECTDEPNTLALVAWIDLCVRSAVAAVHGDRVPAGELRLDFTESWFHITNQGGFHDAHVHGNCSWCGIFYVDAGNAAPARDGAAGNGINRFYGPHSTGGMVRDFGNAYLGRSYVDIEPVDGRLVIFPSYLLHSALPYTGEADRIVLAFNTRTHKA